MAGMSTRFCRFWTLAAITIATSSMNGCVVGDIRDDLRASNQKLDVVTERLTTANTLLTQINTRLDEASGELKEVKGELATSNRTLVSLQDRLVTLDSISASLGRVDDSLRTVKALIERIPVVGSDIKNETAREPAPK